MQAHPKLHTLAWLLFGLVSKCKWLAWAWLTVIGKVMRATPGFPLKANLKNALLSYPWPDGLRFPAQAVEVCDGCTIRLHPHVGEFDFEALFTRKLSYERHVFSELRKRLANYDAIVEIGANVGVYSLFFANARRSESVPVFCFEPSTEARTRLELNQGSRQRNVHIIPAAVFNVAGLQIFYEPKGHLTNGSMSKDFASIFSAEVMSSIVPTVDGSSIASLLDPFKNVLIKIDVEGAEEQVLHSLEALLATHRPDLVLEVLEMYAAALNKIPGLLQLYDCFLITAKGLQKMPKLVADPANRDYLLIARSAADPA